MANPVLRDALIRFEASLSPVSPPLTAPPSRSSWPLEAVVMAISHELPISLSQLTGGGAWLVHADAGTQPSNEALLLVAAVAEVQGILGFTQQEVLQAAGISKRTFQNWRKGTSRRVRPASVGRLWELHTLATDLCELKGTVGVRQWIAGDPKRSKLLRRGEFHDVMAAASLPAPDQQAPTLLFGAAEAEEPARLDVTPLAGSALDADEFVEPPE
ncbi:hypothetical protein ABT270_04615 [Streptomyces sp900105245]|uniref:hypothetical protein n=1 Tax=Streptomyces sp. 900105245 TaxID=3154379 RepID=UPI0033304CFF